MVQEESMFPWQRSLESDMNKKNPPYATNLATWNERMRAITFFLGVALTLLPAPVFGQDTVAKPGKDFFERAVRPVLVAHCFGCHSKDLEKPKGDFRLDRLSPDFAS